MAEQVNRRYFEILDELIISKNSAIEKYARVRFTQYEIKLWRTYGLSLNEVDKNAKRYFSVGFLGDGIRIDRADKTRLDEAFRKLGFAVGKWLDDPDAKPTGCHERCLRLVNELNEVLNEEGLETISNVEKFLDWLTFNYEFQLDESGFPIVEKPYGFPIRIFHDAENRREFRAVLKMLREDKSKMSMQDVWRIIRFKRNHSIITK